MEENNSSSDSSSDCSIDISDVVSDTESIVERNVECNVNRVVGSENGWDDLETDIDSSSGISSISEDNVTSNQVMELQSVEESNLVLEQETNENRLEREYTEYVRDINLSNDCVICLDPGNVILNPLCDCKFYFHEQCYATWLLENEKLCIFCKTDLSSKINVALYQEDNTGILTEYLDSERNQLIQNTIPVNQIIVNRNRSTRGYFTNNISNAQVFIIDNEERQNVNYNYNIRSRYRTTRLCILGVSTTIVSGLILLIYHFLN